LLVSLMIPKFVPSVLHNETNFGIGTRARLRVARSCACLCHGRSAAPELRLRGNFVHRWG